MKNLKLFTFLLMGLATLVMVSCSQDDDIINDVDNTNPVLYKTKAEANAVLVNYLELVGDEYVLNISQKEAEKKGISEFFFAGAQEELKNTNQFIQESKKNPNNELQLTDPQVAIRESKSPELRTDGYDPKGTLTTDGQETVEQRSLWAPSSTRSIKFTCRTNAALTPVYTCKTYSSGLWRATTGVGVLGYPTVVRVPLYVSNDYIGVAFSTTDSNGGSAIYEGSDESGN